MAKTSGAQKIGCLSKEVCGSAAKRQPPLSAGTFQVARLIVGRSLALRNQFDIHHRDGATPKQCPPPPPSRKFRRLYPISNQQLASYQFPNTHTHKTHHEEHHDKCDHFWLRSMRLLDGAI